MRFSVHYRHTLSRQDEEPLIRSAMAIVRSAFGCAGVNYHFGDLRLGAFEHYCELASESKGCLLHTESLLRCSRFDFLRAISQVFGQSQNWFESAPDGSGNDLVALGCGMNPVRLVKLRSTTDAFEKKRDQHRSVPLGNAVKQFSELMR